MFTITTEPNRIVLTHENHAQSRNFRLAHCSTVLPFCKAANNGTTSSPRMRRPKPHSATSRNCSAAQNLAHLLADWRKAITHFQAAIIM